MSVLLPVIPNILEARSLNLLAGASGLGKTALIASLVAAIRDGQTVFEAATTPPPGIGYITTDRPWASAVQWFALAGYADIPHYSLVDDKAFDLKQLHGGKHGPDQFAYCVEQLNLPPGSLIIVDPIALFLGGRLNDYTTVAVASIQIQRYLVQAGYTVIGICHTSKLKADTQDRYARPQDRILGSGALLGYSWTQMYFMSPEEAGREDGKYVFTWNPHHAPPAEFLLTRDMTTGLFDVAGAYPLITNYVDPIAVKVPKVRDVRVTMRMEAVLTCFPPDQEPISIDALVARTTALDPPTPRTTLYRYLGMLEEDGRIEHISTGLYRKLAPVAAATPEGEDGETPDPTTGRKPPTTH